MQIIIHRVNTINSLKTVPPQYGVEIDVRGEGGKLWLNHEPLLPGGRYDELEEYLKTAAAQKIPFVIFDLKEAGYERRVIDLAEKYGWRKGQYFLLDVEFPYLYRATRKEGVRGIAVRYSEAEPIEAVLAQMKDGQPLLDWVWIDTNTELPLNENVIEKLKPFKTCLVCPDRWGRPEDVAPYAARMKALGFSLDAVMTALPLAAQWEALMK